MINAFKKQAIVQNFIQNYSGKVNPDQQAKLCILEIETLFKAIADESSEVVHAKVDIEERVRIELKDTI